MSDSANTAPPPQHQDCRIPVSSVLHCLQEIAQIQSIESVMLSITISFSVTLFFCIQSFCSISVLSSESALNIRWPKYWSFTFSISPSNEYSGLISFRIDWFDLFAAQGILKSSPAQFKSISSSVLRFIYGPTPTSVHDYWKNHSFN